MVTELVDEVGAVIVQVHGHAVGTESGRGDGSVGSAMEERLLAELDVAGDRRILLPRVELDTAIHGVGQLEGGREVDLHAAVVSVGQRRVGIGGDVVPEDLGCFVHRLASADAALLGGPGREAGHAHGLRELVGLRITRRVGDVLGAPGVEVVAAGQRTLGVRSLLNGAADDADGIALISRAGEAFVPFFGGEPRATAGRGVVVGQVDLGLHAFVADPESITAIGTECFSVAEGGARHGLGTCVDGSPVVSFKRRQACGQAYRAVGNQWNNFRRNEADRCAEVVDIGLGFGDLGGGDDASAVRINIKVGAIRDVVGWRAGDFSRGINVERRGEPA